MLWTFLHLLQDDCSNLLKEKTRLLQRRFISSHRNDAVQVTTRSKQFMVVVKQHYMNHAVNLRSAHIKKRKQHIFGGKRCRYAVPARTVTKKHCMQCMRRSKYTLISFVRGDVRSGTMIRCNVPSLYRRTVL